MRIVFSSSKWALGFYGWLDYGGIEALKDLLSCFSFVFKSLQEKILWSMDLSITGELNMYLHNFEIRFLKGKKWVSFCQWVDRVEIYHLLIDLVSNVITRLRLGRELSRPELSGSRM